MSIPIIYSCNNRTVSKKYELGTTLHDVVKDLDVCLDYPIMGAMVNNKIKDLSYQIYKPKNIHFFDTSHPEGRRIYVRSLIFVLYKAIAELYPKAELTIVHPISNGLFCSVNGGNFLLSQDKVERIKIRMHELVKADLPIVRTEMETEEAIKLFEKQGLHAKTELLRTRGYVYTSVYKLGEHIDYFYGSLAPCTGDIKVFDLQHHYGGMILQLPNPERPNEIRPFIEQPQLNQIFKEYNHWVNILNVKNIGDLNRAEESGEISDLIKIAEALQEKKLAQIADKIYKRRKHVRMILISGPSSSGKTTFAQRLSIQLKINGMTPVKISMDNYFVDREHTPRDKDGELDFESLYALDLELFNRNMTDLMDGKEIRVPKFSFEDGKKYYDGETLKIKKKDILVIEGIHGLNPKLTEHIPVENKFKVYVSAVTPISIDGHNRISTRDNRLVRRIIRDFRYRGYSATETIKRWPSVIRGEIKNIWPYQEEADIMFNSALLYELGVLKTYAEPILKKVQMNEPEFAEAGRLLKFFSFFHPISIEETPPTSILREFLGGSSFGYD